MRVPLVEEKDTYSSTLTLTLELFVMGGYSGFSVLVELLLTEAVMKQGKAFNLFIKGLASICFKVGESIRQY